MAAHARLKNEFTEDEKYHKLMTCEPQKRSFTSMKQHGKFSSRYIENEVITVENLVQSCCFFLSPTEFMSEILILLISSQFENKLCIAVKLSFRKHSFILL